MSEPGSSNLRNLKRPETGGGNGTPGKFYDSTSFDSLHLVQSATIFNPNNRFLVYESVSSSAEYIGTSCWPSSPPRPLPPLKLIRINPPSNEESRDCLDLEMTIFEFASHPPYTALSYTWGDASLEEEIALNGESVRIQVNLATALRQLKQMGTIGYIWADAICINQNDPAEKSTVVQHMDQIFGAADKVFAWLGVSEADSADPAESSDRLWGHLMEIGDLFWAHFGRENRLNSHSFDLDDMPSSTIPKLYGMFRPAAEGGFPARAYAKFSNRAYWQRIWVLQEVYLARELQFGCGDKIMDSQQLAGALCLLEAFKKRALFDNKTKLTENGPLRDFVLASPCYPEMQQLVFHKTIYEPDTHSLRIAMTNFCVKELPRGSKASDTRDMIFGLLGFAKPGERTLITPDYGQPVQTTYRVATLALMTHGFTDILAWAQPLEKRIEGLPSWVPDFSSTIYESMCSQNQAKPWRPRFEASSGLMRPLKGRVNNANATMTRKLQILGVILDEISEVGSLWHPRMATNTTVGSDTDSLTKTSDMASRSASYEDILRLLTEVDGFASKSPRMTDPHSSPRPPDYRPQEACWRVPCADQLVIDSKLVRDHDSTKASYYAALSLATGFVKQSTAPASSVNDVEVSLAARPYIEAMLRWVKKRPMTSAKGYVGLGPGDVKVGDSLVLLSGCNAPYVLRRVGPIDYNMVGEAYVHGVMDGQITGGSQQFIGIL